MLYKMGGDDCTCYHLPLFQSGRARLSFCTCHTSLLFNNRV
nr:MAG TPA: hypothetical protein [Caudoviricetes sp.]